MELSEVKEALSVEIAAWLVVIFESDEPPPLEELGPLSEDLCAKLRALAITTLLSDGNENAFFHHLIRSGRVRIHFLERCLHQAALDDFRRASSRSEPFFDTLTAGDFERAQRIVELSPATFFQNAEYEEDYSYTQIIHCLTRNAGGTERQRIDALIDQFESSLQGTVSARLQVCRALLQAQQDDFDQAFEVLLAEQDAQLDADRSRNRMEEALAVASQRVFIEGLALLRLADRFGLSTEPEYRYCPALARLPMSRPFPGK